MEKRKELELIFEQYRKHKFYTLFMSDVNVKITSTYDDVGGGRSNETSDQTANAAIRVADKKHEAKELVARVEKAVEQLPKLEKRIIELRYMCKDHHYINDYTVYEYKLPMSPNTYRKIRNQAFEKLYIMLVIKNDKKITKH